MIHTAKTKTADSTAFAMPASRLRTAKTDMRLTIDSTDQVTEINGAKARVWRGKSERGVECLCFMTCIAVADDSDHSEFERELKEQLPPGRVVPLRNIV